MTRFHNAACIEGCCCSSRCFSHNKQKRYFKVRACETVILSFCSGKERRTDLSFSIKTIFVTFHVYSRVQLSHPSPLYDVQGTAINTFASIRHSSFWAWSCLEGGHGLVGKAGGQLLSGFCGGAPCLYVKVSLSGTLNSEPLLMSRPAPCTALSLCICGYLRDAVKHLVQQFISTLNLLYVRL